MPSTEATLYDIEKGAAWITLNRPEIGTHFLLFSLASCMNTSAQRMTIQTYVASSSQVRIPAFCAGADLKSPPGGSIEGRRSVPYPDVLTRIQDSDKPVIAAVNGAAFAGGLGLVGAADIVVAREDVQFSFSEVRIGVIPAVISVVCIPKLGTHHAMKLFLTGERFTGAQAVEMGFAHRAVSGDQLRQAVEEEIDMINQGGPNAVVQCKKLVRAVPNWDRDEAFAKTAEWSGRMFRSDEGAEGMAAFREKRKASWIPEE